MPQELEKMNFTEVTRALEENALSVPHWQQLLDIVASENDVLSSASLNVILRGIQALDGSKGGGSTFSVLTGILRRLAGSFNSPKLFKEAGKAYLQELHMPKTAREHLNRAVELTCKDADLKPLLDAADTLLASQKNKPSGGSGVEKAHQPQFNVTKLIRRSGKLTFSGAPPVTTPEPVEQPDPAVSKISPVERLKQVRVLLKVKEWDQALRLLRSLPKNVVDPDALWEAWTGCGEGMSGCSRFDKAEIAFRAAAEIHPDVLVSQFNLGFALQMNQRLDEALKAYNRSDELHPNHPKVWCNLGSVYFLQEKYKAAEEAFRISIAQKPDYARAWDNLGAALGAQGEMDEALNACRKALELKPGYQEAAFKIGVIYFGQKMFREALPFLTSISVPGLSFFSNAYTAMTLANMGTLIGAEHHLSVATQSPDAIPEVLSIAWGALGRARMERSEFNKAREGFQEACRLDPKNSQNWLDLGLTYQFAQDSKVATECFMRAMELDEAESAAAAA